jgi:hypothetical protein
MLCKCRKKKRKRKHIAMRISEERNSGKTTSNRTGSVICNDKAKRDRKNVFRSVRRIDNRHSYRGYGWQYERKGGGLVAEAYSTLEEQRHMTYPMTTKANLTRKPKEQDCTSGGRPRKHYAYECK